MCGIAGFLCSSGARLESAAADLERMTQALTHRGPDAVGYWTDAEPGVALGHRRLSIVDLTEAGAQPMHSHSGRYVLSYNGEIYNSSEIRREIERQTHVVWQGHSDTEVLLAAVDLWGLEPALDRVVGMFAFALWDRLRQELTLARDRLGEKPLFYGWDGDTLVFASELKSLRSVWRSGKALDRGSLLEFIRFSYIPAPHSIFVGIRKLEAAHYVVFRRETLPGVMPQSRRYWAIAPLCTRAMQNGQKDPALALEELESLLVQSVRGQLVADVPVGAFLSGGIDSSIIVALMQRERGSPVDTFTIGFQERGFDETVFARRVAEHLGTRHRELYVSSKDALALVPQLASIFDEPLADSSQIPTYFVSQLARQSVTVSLSGDGGDELFDGYSHYFLTNSLWNSIQRFPRLARQSGKFARWIPRHAIFDKLAKVTAVAASRSETELYECLADCWRGAPAPVLDARRRPWWKPEVLGLDVVDPFVRMSAQDLLTYLPESILTKVDRAAMAVSLETRIPFLDHRVVEYALTLPTSLKVANGSGKTILRRLLAKHVPSALFDRPKSGFSVPIAQWLRGPLRDWADDLLACERLQREHIFDPRVVAERWSEHRSGARDWHASLWNVLMFQSWASVR